MGPVNRMLTVMTNDQCNPVKGCFTLNLLNLCAMKPRSELIKPMNAIQLDSSAQTMGQCASASVTRG